jgi:S1-C subfamily serine protease
VTTLIDDVPEFHGPEHSGAVTEYPVGPGPRLLRVTIKHQKYLANRTIVYLTRHRGGIVWQFDMVVREGETKTLLIPLPVEKTLDPFGRPTKENFRLVINLIAFRDTPSSISYRIEAEDVELPSEYAIAFTKSESNNIRAYPRPLVLPAVFEKSVLRLTNLTDGAVKLGVAFFESYFYRGGKRVTLGPRGTREVEVEEGERAEVSLIDAEAEAGYIAAELAKYAENKTEGSMPSAIRVRSGDEIKPGDRPWVGSLGVEKAGYLLTNAHVCPNEGEEVYLTRNMTEKIAKIGKVERVARIRTVSRLDILLSALLGFRLPANTADIAAIRPEPNVVYEKFREWPNKLAEVHEGDRVYSRGRTSGEREGTVRDVHASAVVEWAPGKYAIFEDCILLEMLTQPGDSGSAVVSDKGWVGLIFAGDPSNRIGLAIKGVNILRWLAGAR